MTAIDSPPDRAVDLALAAVADAADGPELEAAWTAGLRGRRDPADRDRILAAAGHRLDLFDNGSDDRLRLVWLGDVVNETRLRGDRPLDQELAPVVTAQIREAFAHAKDDLAEFRAALAIGEGMDDFSARSPLAAARLCDLGRVAERLRGTELMALVSDEDAHLTRALADSWAFRHRLLAAVPESLRVSRDDLLGWAKGAGADQELTRLLRRLIRETTQVERIEFPSGTGVATPGWDGIVESAEGNQFVPDGRSGWEVSVQQPGSDRKARNDYDKRVAEVEAEQRRDMDYVAVVCAPWTKARDFENEKRSLGDFRSVRALNVDALEDWLECAPLTTVWLRELIGKPVDGVRLLSAWWAKWLESTSPALDAGVVLAGRDGQAKTLQDRCKQPGGGVVTVGGQVHRDEILAFVAAALIGSDDPDCHDQSPLNALYVDDHDTAKRLLAAEASPPSSPHTRALTVVVPSADFAEHLPAGSQHRMIVPIPGSSQPEVVLEAADAAVAAEQLRAAGVDHDRAHDLGSLARMSLMALRRHLAVNPEVHRPRWATGPVEKALRRSLLLHGWDQSRDGDREIVECFVGRPHDEVAETINSLDSGDAPMILTGDIRHVMSPMDTWTMLDHQLARADIEAFAKIAHEVLTEPDPLHGTAGLERIQAQCDGVRAKYSSTIKQGVATTLALMGSRPRTLLGSVAPASSSASGIVRRILKSANADESSRTWSAVVEILPLLAEADPEAVLSGLRTCLAEPHAFAAAMFADRNFDDLGFPPPSPHLSVVEALELLAWSSEHLAATADLLARLAATDPGGRWSDRPAESLASIMCPWMPNTSAAAQERLTVLKMLRRQHGPVAWDLMMSMLPNAGGIQMHSRGPLYRDWKCGEPVVAHHDHVQTVTSVTEMLLEDVGEDPDRWAGFVQRTSELSEAIRRGLISVLDRVADTEPEEAFKYKVWPVLQQMVALHRRFSVATWALSEAELAPFDRLLERLRPADPVIVHRDLFSSDPMLVEGVAASDGRKTFQEALGGRQAEAVGTILSDGGIKAVLRFAEAVDQPRRVGTALARNDATFDIDVLGLMHVATEIETQVALGYFERRFAAFGWEGLDRLIADHDPSPRVVADLHRAPPPVKMSWTRVDALGTKVAEEYWTRATYYDIGIPDDSSQLLHVSQRLQAVGRYEFATMLLSFGADSHESETKYLEEVADCLEQRIQEAPSASSDRTSIDGHHLASLLKVVGRHRDDLGIGRVARLEWLYYPALRHDPGFRAPNIYRAMSEDPHLFAWMVETACRPASASEADRTEPDEARKRMALNAFNALRSWPDSHFVPGLDEPRGLEAEGLDRWIDGARERLAKIDRADIGDKKIGAALAGSPPDPDDKWPGRAVCDLIERLQSDNIDKGFRVAVLNQRGTTFRTLTAGGASERELARHYHIQKQRLSQWPRTAAIFAALAQSYEREADDEDAEAEAHRRGLPL